MYLIKLIRNLFRPAPTEIESRCRVKIVWVATAIHDRTEFQERARCTANELGPDAVEILAGMLHGEPSPPAEIAHDFPGLGEWITARQFAIFEIFFYVGAPSLPTLRRVAFGQYDWTQGNAIEVLCRLAARGIERTQIMKELKNQLPDMREEAHYYAAEPLIMQSENDLILKDILVELLTVPEFKASYEYVLSQST